jgi:hypothetical protein
MSTNLSSEELAALAALARNEGSWMAAPDELLQRVLNDHVAARRWVHVAAVAMVLWERSA